ncbi:unnamed protein product [Orchesella dallaii]|uniref:C2H2-type domain-containing protein n=1 Tax=Orchesella dallaii TaxID=48710 RepID=A0ABP1S061_9HEXA
MNSNDVLRSCYVKLVRLELPQNDSSSTKTCESLRKNEKKHECIVCSNVLKTHETKGGMKYQLNRHLGELPFSCPFCGIFLITNNRLEHHIRAHINEKPYSCLECSSEFSGSTGLFLHHRFVHKKIKRPRKSECVICRKKFLSKSALNVHFRGHTGEKPYSCSVCAVTFAQKAALDRHSQLHSYSKPFQCKVCLKYFRRKDTLNVHTKSVHENVRPHSCYVCGMGFPSPFSCRRHLSTHLNEIPYKCQTCGKTFRRKDAFQDHLDGHKEIIRKYKCSDCPKCFRRLTNLRIHFLRKHSTVEEWPYSCIFCDKKMSVKSSFEYHLRGHINERPFTCTVCSRDFKDSKHLYRHSKAHKT